VSEVAIAERAVTLKDSFKGREGYEVSALFGALVDALREYDARRSPTAGYEEYVALCRRVVESWEFDGDPGDAASYEALEAFQSWPLFSQVLAHVSAAIMPKKASGEEPMDSS